MPIFVPPYNAAQLPAGRDRADGESGRIGTAPPFSRIIVNGQPMVGTGSIADAINIQELPDSPEIERAEQCTAIHKFRMAWDEAKTRITFIGRGSLFTDSDDDTWRVLSAKIKGERGGIAVLETVSESISFDSPPDEFQITPVELGINIIKYPRYLYALLPLDGDSAETVNVKQSIVRLIQQYIDAPVAPEKSAVVAQLQMLTSHTPETLYAEAAAQEIIQKLWLQEDNPYIIAWKIIWSAYYFRPIFLNPGGYQEDPITQGNLPDYFGSPSGDYSVDTIFDIIQAVNPQCYADTQGDLILSSLRQADDVEYQRTWFKVTRSWIVSPVGNWDPQIYTFHARPTTWNNGVIPFKLLEAANNFPPP